MKITRIGQMPNTNPPVFGWSIEADDNEVEDLCEGLQAYIECLEEFEQEDKSERIEYLESLQNVLLRAMNEGV